MYSFGVLIPILGILLVLVPVTGLTVILTARYAMTPLVETLVKALRESGFAASPGTQLQLEDLSEQVQLLSEQVARLSEGRDFDRQLLRGDSPKHSDSVS